MDSLIKRVRAYVFKMVDLERTVAIYKDSDLVTWCTFFILDSLEDIPSVYHRDDWSVVLDYPEGQVIYIDKIASQEWNLSMRRQLQEEMLNRYPQLRWVAWYRPTEKGPERLVVRSIKETVHV